MDQTTAFAGHVLSRMWSLNWNAVNMGSLHCHVPSRNALLIYGAHESVYKFSESKSSWDLACL